MLNPISSGFSRAVRSLALGIAVLILLYLVCLPLYPLFRYKFFTDTADFVDQKSNSYQLADIASGTEQNTNATSANQRLPKSSLKNNHPNRIIIKKIGVNAPIIESADEKYGLNHGAWLMPQGSTPDKGGNTVITAHRFKYLPPNNLTFFLINKLTKGDVIEISWKGADYRYLVESTKIVPATEVSILEPTEEPTLTIFSCDPIFSTENRLVVLAKPE